MYYVDLFRGESFLACLGKFTFRHIAEGAALYSFLMNGAKPENAGVRWQVRQSVYDGEGELDHCVLVKEWIAA